MPVALSGGNSAVRKPAPQTQRKSQLGMAAASRSGRRVSGPRLTAPPARPPGGDALTPGVAHEVQPCRRAVDQALGRTQRSHFRVPGCLKGRRAVACAPMITRVTQPGPAGARRASGQARERPFPGFTLPRYDSRQPRRPRRHTSTAPAKSAKPQGTQNPHREHGRKVTPQPAAGAGQTGEAVGARPREP